MIRGEVGRGSFVTGGNADSALSPNWDELLRPGSGARPPSGGTGMLSFATSRPSEELFPLDDFRLSCQEILDSAELSAILQLGSPGGYEPLRQYLLDGARREGVVRDGDDLLITNGCQQALDLIRSVLIGSGDRVVLEDPVYPGLKNLFLQAGAELSGVAVGLEGIDPDQFDRTVAKDRPRAVMVSPNFQNPTGATMPLSSRERILRTARQAGAIVIENDIYGALRYQGDALPTLKQLDRSGGAILLRSFSKVAFPGLRVGWVIGPRAFIARLTEAKQLSDLHTDQFSQAALLRFAQSGRMEKHLQRMLQTGAERLRAALKACEEYLPRGARFTRPRGGMNLWVTLPEPLDTSDMLPRAQREGVTYLPGRYFSISRRHSSALRLSFAGLRPEQIERGVSVLGKIFSAELEAIRSAGREPALAMV
ncbi:MAG: PLP-dependent aminotransferase family protein [Acidobacteriota bacterium]|nr:PLP-dependent aminotransferase family protein [Acidobacteriota bacterium]